MKSDWSLEAWMVRETREWLERVDDSIERVQLRHQEIAQNAMKRVRPLLDHPRPLDPIRELHREILEDISALRTEEQLSTFEMVVLSELLCAFPLRAKHWPMMHLTQGLIPDNPPADALHVYDVAPGPNLSQYAIIVPTSGLKNQETSLEIRDLDPPRYVYNLPAFLGDLITSYLQEVRPQIVDSTDRHLFSATNVGSMRHRLVRFQERHLVQPLGLSRAWVFHAYRVLVATHAMKNARERPVQVAASLLLDSELMIRKVYGHFRAEDAHDSARSAIAPLASERRQA